MLFEQACLEEEKPFRTLVVVPGSHRDGTFERLSVAGGESAPCKCKDAASRAVQLDVRPTAEAKHSSVWVAWDSRVVHQGHTHDPHAAPGGFAPKLHRPQLFQPEECDAWRAAVAEQGYVVVADPLPPEDVVKAMRFLLRDLQHLKPGLKSLRDVTEVDLPRAIGANDLRASSGICHGEFAWYVRAHPCMTKLFEALFGVSPGTPLVGSVDVVALAPPRRQASGKPGKQWLHLDYTPPQGYLWQTQIQLFPKDPALGSQWERVAVMICKAPVSWCSPSTEARLLACCVTGTASRATAGVTLGKMHAERNTTSKGSRKQQPRENIEGCRIPVKLNPEVLDEEVCGWAPGGLSLQSIQHATVADVLSWLSTEQLRRLVMPGISAYLSVGHFGQGKVVLDRPVVKKIPKPLSISTMLASSTRKTAMNSIEEDLLPLSQVASQILSNKGSVGNPDSDISVPRAPAGQKLKLKRPAASKVFESLYVSIVEQAGQVDRKIMSGGAVSGNADFRRTLNDRLYEHLKTTRCEVKAAPSQEGLKEGVSTCARPLKRLKIARS